MVDYEFYRVTYGGDKVDESPEFTRLSNDAEALVEYYTFGRSAKVDDEGLLKKVKLTICKLIDEYKIIEEMGNIKSYSEGKQSITYVDPVNPNHRLYEIIYVNLSLTGLMYRGL
jgi:hypothetical protein